MLHLLLRTVPVSHERAHSTTGGHSDNRRADTSRTERGLGVERDRERARDVAPRSSAPETSFSSRRGSAEPQGVLKKTPVCCVLPLLLSLIPPHTSLYIWDQHVHLSSLLLTAFIECVYEWSTAKRVQQTCLGYSATYVNRAYLPQGCSN